MRTKAGIQPKSENNGEQRKFLLNTGTTKYRDFGRSTGTDEKKKERAIKFLRRGGFKGGRAGMKI